MVLACPAASQVVAGCMESIAWRRACVGGEMWVAIVAVSWGCLYSSAVRTLCSVCSEAARKYLRHYVGVIPAKAGLYMEHVSRAGLGGRGVGSDDGWGLL